jgi:hypothetical protein
MERFLRSHEITGTKLHKGMFIVTVLRVCVCVCVCVRYTLTARVCEDGEASCDKILRGRELEE